MLVQEVNLLSRYSSLHKLLTSLAWLLRYKKYLRRQSGEVKRNLTVDEIVAATKEVIKLVQKQAFPKELAVLLRISQGLRLVLPFHERTSLPLWDTLVLFGNLAQ